MHRSHAGVTMVEILVVIAILAMVTIAVISLSLQSMRLFARYQPLVMGQAPHHQAPKAAMMLGLKRMEREMREAMFIRLGSSATAVEIVLPRKGEDGFIALDYVVDAQANRQTLMTAQGQHVCFFLGRADADQPGRAIPDPANGDTIFRVTSGVPTTKGSDILDNDGNLAAAYDDATVIIKGISMISYIFSYFHADEALDAPLAMNTRIIRVNLTYPVTITTGAGRSTRQENLVTEFFLRNFEAL